MLRGGENEYYAARRTAARWLARRKVAAHELPTDAEIRAQIYEIAGLFTEVPPVDGMEPGTADFHPDTIVLMRMLLERLEGVPLNLAEHPEGDALYHSLQVYELGMAECPFDEEFLLACLLHEVGMAIDRRNAVEAAVEALQYVTTDRTRFLIRNRPHASEYLLTGRISRSLRRSEHFEDLMQLARCDRDGRVPGMVVSTVDEALDYITGLSTAWDDV